MQFPFPFIDVLVIPTDAGSGDPRIIIDGVNGTIDFYNAANVLIARASVANGFEVFTAGGALARLTAAQLELGTANVDETDEGAIVAFGGGITGSTRQEWVQITSPTVNNNDRARIEVKSESTNGTLPTEIGLFSERINMFNGVGFPSGTATLVAGTVTVNNPLILSTTLIFTSRQATGGTPGHLSCTRVAGTSFTINSSSATDTSTIAYLLID